MPRGVRATTARTCTGEGSPFHRSSAVSAWSVTSSVTCGVQPRATCDHASLCGLAPLPLGRVRAHHRSGRDVSFLFQSQRSPAPDLRPVTCPNRWGDFPRGRWATQRVGQRYERDASRRDDHVTSVERLGESVHERWSRRCRRDHRGSQALSPSHSRVGCRISPPIGTPKSAHRRMEAL